MFRAPQWHGATQTHFPLRPRKSAWRCDIANAISPHGLPTHYHPARQRHAAFTPACFALPSGTPPRKRTSHQSLANPHHERNFATRSTTHKKQTYHTIPQIIPLTSDTLCLHQHVSRSPEARCHANTLTAKAAQIPMALRHHERNFATRSALTLEETYHMIAPIVPLTSDTPRLHQHASADISTISVSCLTNAIF